MQIALKQYSMQGRKMQEGTKKRVVGEMLARV